MALRISSLCWVGRTNELAAFDRLIERAAHGGGAALTVAGEAGIGKSRLVAEFDGVHIRARVAAHAEASAILVSQTVTDPVAGPGIQFEPRGEHELKGVPGRWRRYAVLGASSRGSPAPV